MNLTHEETDLVFAIMRELTGEFSHKEVRKRVGQWLLELLDADHFASYVWEESRQEFVSGVFLNMSKDNLLDYERYFQFRDPITKTLQQRKSATPVSQIMSHNRLSKTEFYNDFLQKDGLCYGMNYFAYDRGQNIGDIRIWRGNNKDDFSERDAMIVDAIGPSFVNALVRANKHANAEPALRFVQIKDEFGFTNREAEIADLLVIGLSDEDICASLNISKPTLRSHISAIFKKSGAQRRTQISQILIEKSAQ